MAPGQIILAGLSSATGAIYDANNGPESCEINIRNRSKSWLFRESDLVYDVSNYRTFEFGEGLSLNLECIW